MRMIFRLSALGLFGFFPLAGFSFLEGVRGLFGFFCFVGDFWFGFVLLFCGAFFWLVLCLFPCLIFSGFFGIFFGWLVRVLGREWVGVFLVFILFSCFFGICSFFIKAFMVILEYFSKTEPRQFCFKGPHK